MNICISLMLSHQAYAARSVYVAILVGPYILTVAAQHLGPVSATGEDPVVNVAGISIWTDASTHD
jgi:hypothetical protein